MSRLIFGKRTLATILIASFCLVGMSSTVEAGWGHHRRGYSFGYAWPSYRSCGFYGNYGYSGYGYSGYRAYYPTYYRSYYRSYAPSYYVSPYIGYGCYGYGFGYGYRPWVGFGGFYSANSVSTDRLPSVEPPMMPELVEPAIQIATNDQRAASGNIELKLDVPEDARVTINDRLTSLTGRERTFAVPGGEHGEQYDFVVRVEFERDGQTVTETKQVALRAGQVSSLAFDPGVQSTQFASVDEPVSTTVTLHVPEEARVYLDGHEMKQKGGTRVFETTKLRAGEELENYSIRVITGDGEAESREKLLTLVGGETQEIEFDFSPAQRLVAR